MSVNKLQWDFGGTPILIAAQNIILDSSLITGTLTADDLTKLQETPDNYIVYGTEIYKLYDNNIDGDLLTYICITKADSIIKVKSIIVRISTLVWQFSELVDSSAATLNELTPKVMRALLTPVSAPTKTELVGVDDGNAQTMIEIGEGLLLENGVLKATGAGDSGEYVTTKKKILAKNDFGLSFPITLSEAIQAGDIIEIRSSDRIYRVMVSSFPQSIDTSDLEAVEGSSSYNTAVFRGKIQISADGTQITSTLASLYWLNIPSSGNVTVNSTDAAINKVYEVAKIIE